MMSSEERKKILQMVEDGKISADEAANLMRALVADEAEAEMEVFDAGAGSGFEGSGTSAPEFEDVKARALRFAMIPLWVGVAVAVLSAWGIYAIQQSVGVNFWFFCLLFPLMFGVLLISLGASGPGSKWLYVNVDRRYAHDGPRNITFGIPLPLGITTWFLRTFGHTIHGMDRVNVDGVIEVLNATSKSDEPFIVNVDEGANGERVQVYIG
jgi:hypothetical protein